MPNPLRTMSLIEYLVSPLTPAELRERGLAACVLCEEVFRRETLTPIAGELYCSACVKDVCPECGALVESPYEKYTHNCRDTELLRPAERGE